MLRAIWENKKSLVLINPTYDNQEREKFQKILSEKKAPLSHIWLSTSGSSSAKWVGLSKQALLSSAQAVNQHLASQKEDRWVNALPHFHVGGLGVWARAYLTQSKVFDFRQDHSEKWQPSTFYRYLEDSKGTLTALVPTQLHDLVQLKKKAPASLRAVVIGGGFLPLPLYQAALDLNWPILPSYGLTECGSQVATAALESWKQQDPTLYLLPHIQASQQEGRLAFHGTSLLSLYACFEKDEIKFYDPKEKGWFLSEDRGSIQERKLEILGRSDAIFKIAGESVDLARLEKILQNLCLKSLKKGEVTLVAMPDDRLGHSICMISSSPMQELSYLIDQFQVTVLPFERIKSLYFVKQFPRSSIGKILKNDLIKLLGSLSPFSICNHLRK